MEHAIHTKHGEKPEQEGDHDITQQGTHNQAQTPEQRQRERDRQKVAENPSAASQVGHEPKEA